MKELDIKKKLYSQLEDLYRGIYKYIDKDDQIIDRKTFEALPLDEALKEVFSYRDYVYTNYDLLNGENVEMFDIELPDMDLRGYDLRNLHLTNYVPGTFDEYWEFTPSNVNLEGTGCVVNLNTAQYVLSDDGKRNVDLRGFNLQGCKLYGRITENLGEGCYKKVIEDDSNPSGNGKEIDVYIGDKTLTDAYKSRMARTTPLKLNERYIYGRILKKGPSIRQIMKNAKLNDMDLSEAELSEQLDKIKQLVNNQADISYTGAFIATHGPHTLGKENYYLDLNNGIISAIRNGEDAIVVEELLAAGADLQRSFYPVEEKDGLVHWTTPAGLAVLNKEKATEYLDVLMKNGLSVDDMVDFTTTPTMQIVESRNLLDYKVARDYLWERLDQYPELEDRIKEADKKYNTVRNQENVQETEETPEEIMAKKKREEITTFLKEKYELTDKEIETIEKKDPEFFIKRTVKDDLDVKLKILEANDLAKTVLLKTPKHLNQTPEIMYARTKFFSREKIRVNDKNYHKTIFMPKTKFAENYGRRLVKRDSIYSDRVYTEEVDKKLKKKYPLPNTAEKLNHEVRTMNKSLND